MVKNNEVGFRLDSTSTKAELSSNNGGGDAGTNVHINRAIFADAALHEELTKARLASKRRQILSREVCKAKCSFNPFPFIRIFRNYEWREYLLRDVISGLSVGMLVIPQAIAYAILAHVRPKSGFYSAFFAMLIYFFFGTSQHINMTSQGVVSLMVGQVITGRIGVHNASNENCTLAPDDCGKNFDESMKINAVLCIFVGGFQFLMGVCRLGFITVFFSDALAQAFTCAAACHIVVSQLPHMLGIQNLGKASGVGALFKKIILVTQRLNNINVASTILSIVCIAVLLIGRVVNPKLITRIKVPVPFDIIVLISALLASEFGNWEEKFHIDIVGNIPRGFDPPTLPDFTIGIDFSFIMRAFMLAVIAYTISISIAKNLAVSHGYEVDSNQEFMAYGTINIVNSFFNGFVSASSLACTAVHEALGGRSQVYGLVAVLVTLTSIVGVGPFFRSTPKAALSAIIIANLVGMLAQIQHLPNLWRTNRFDFAIWLVTFAAVVGVSVDYGLLIGLAFSLATIIYRTQAPAAYVLGRVPGTDIYRNVRVNKLAQEVPGVKIVKYDGNLYFGSVENFRRNIYHKTKLNPQKIKEMQKKIETKSPDGDEIITALSDIRIDDQIIEYNNQGDEFTIPPCWEMDESTGSQTTEESSEKESHHEDEEQEEEEEENPIHVIILDLSACAFIDSVGVRMLKLIIKDYGDINIQVYMANVVVSVRKMLLQAGFYKQEDQELIFVTVHDAVLTALMNLVDNVMETRRSSAIPETLQEEEEEEDKEREDREEKKVEIKEAPPITEAEVTQMKQQIAQLQQSNKLLRKLVDFQEMAGEEEAPIPPPEEALRARRSTVVFPAQGRRLSLYNARRNSTLRTQLLPMRRCSYAHGQSGSSAGHSHYSGPHHLKHRPSAAAHHEALQEEVTPEIVVERF